ncbi:ribonuclease P protein component [Verrucomicrobiaceae bacterium R5-34]|uniref:Ribonuclease P protein component n=1 Tax=Oceaniferula flava TaxID=2800421 RepID=A0AAE2VCM1_9BACT|nr:ribonuclease P protein component [Oceaniferula flavus]MBK1831981.1 ribonuclease P protein component [Verrucomicrobiaceae bacterium R5-34]MBK1855251.1 ribonuclease P protein component [Oceaniferula flavus]MBM1136557.1 ribonuclease P protein component [Oceaniferula flavus]
MRLRRKYSMTRHAEFSLTRQKGQAKGGAYLVLSTLADEQLPHHKAGVIITKKVGNAVTRNHLRRRVQAILAKHLHRIQGRRYIVTVIRWRAPEASFDQLEADWLKQANRLGILDTTP